MFYTALELEPEDWLAMSYYGEVLGRLGRSDSAVDAFKKSVEYEMQQ